MGLWSSKKRKRPTLAEEPADTMESVRQTSSLPSGVFKAFDPNVEQALKGPVADVFLEHMAASTGAKTKQPGAPVAQVAANQVDAEEIARLFEMYSNEAREPIPDLLCRFESERIWVLADLALNGSGRARELATRELHAFIQRMDAGEPLEPALLDALVTSISESPDGQASALLQALLETANEALTRIRQTPND